MNHWKRTRSAALLVVITLMGVSCSDAPLPVMVDMPLSTAELRQHLTPDVAASLTHAGEFGRNEPQSNGTAMIGRGRAVQMAAHFLAELGPSIIDGLERQHGSSIDLEALKPMMNSVYLAETPYEPLDEAVMLPARKHWGAYYLIHFAQQGIPAVEFAVSVHATDVDVVGGHLRKVGTAPYGNEFRWGGIPQDRPYGTMVGPEHAALLAALATDAKVAGQPRFVRRGGLYAPFHGYWAVPLDRSVAARSNSAATAWSTSMVYVDERGQLHAASPDAIGPEAVVIRSRRPGLSGTWTATRKAPHQNQVVPTNFAAAGGVR